MMTHPELAAQSVHLVGIGGTGMSALAGYLRDRGVMVTGSDLRTAQAVRVLIDSGLHVTQGHAARNLPSRVDLVVRSLAVKEDVAELEVARQRGIPVLTYPEALARLARGRRTLGVAGTHGKSTTTAILASLLDAMELGPSWVLGGAIAGRGLAPWRAGAGDVIVLESCEYARSFLSIPADIGVITAIDDDHLDIYGDLAGVRRTFMDYAERTLEGGGQLAIAADLGLHDDLVARGHDRGRMLTYGLGADADLCANVLETSPAGTRFVLSGPGLPSRQCTMPQPGAHNVANALAALAGAALLGLDPFKAGPCLADFRGVARRLESLGTHRGALFFDDYAHHPTAVAAVLDSLRAAYPGRRLVAIFEPHQVARTITHAASFNAALARADLIAVTEIYSAREQDRAAMSGAALVEDLIARHCQATFARDIDAVLEFIDVQVEAGDVVVMMGAGDIGDDFAAALRHQRVTDNLIKIPA